MVIFGAWKGLGVEKQGHNLGHMKQENNPIWIKIRQYNCRMLVKLMEQLESVPEGNGSMMDSTLIVYTSNNADKHTPVARIGQLCYSATATVLSKRDASPNWMASVPLTHSTTHCSGSTEFLATDLI